MAAKYFLIAAPIKRVAKYWNGKAWDSRQNAVRYPLSEGAWKVIDHDDLKKAGAVVVPSFTDHKKVRAYFLFPVIARRKNPQPRKRAPAKQKATGQRRNPKPSTSKKKYRASYRMPGGTRKNLEFQSVSDSAAVKYATGPLARKRIGGRGTCVSCKALPAKKKVTRRAT